MPLFSPFLTPSTSNSDTAHDLIISGSRRLMVITGLFFGVLSLFLSGSAPTEMMATLFFLSTGMIIITITSYRMVEDHYLPAQLVWQAGLAFFIFSVGMLLNLPVVFFLSIILPLIGMFTLGWPTALVFEVLLAGFAAWAIAQPGSTFSEYVIAIPIAGGMVALLGWAATGQFSSLAEWSYTTYQAAASSLDDAREQQMELVQTQEDLSKAFQELARLTDRLKSLQHIAEEARQAKTEFVANVSHELRTPLNMIIGFTEVIASSPGLYGGRLPTALMTDISAIQRSSKHLLNLVNDVLDLSQVESGRMALSRDWTSVCEMIQESTSIVEGLFKSKGLYLRLELDQNIPPVYCDRTRIRQVIINLLSNAGRFTETGGVLVRAVHGDDFQVSITDTGPGIPEDEQKRMFEPFQQLDNSIRRLYGGSGLGLTISKQFIEMHGGRMWLESQVGKGTSFTFSLPFFAALADNEPHPNHPARRGLIPGDEYGYSLRTRPSRAPIARPVPRLVVYEKEQSLQRVLNRYLSEVEVVATQTIAEAEEALNSSPAQALVINAPPNEDLASALIAAAPFGTPVITCWLPGEVEAAGQLGVIQYLMKPVTREKLLAVLEELPKVIHSSEPVHNILVADDEPDELHLFARMLEFAPNGYQILQATDGIRTLELLRSRKIDILLLDLVMPGLSGFQVLDEKSLDPSIRDIPVIVISSRDPLGEAITSSTVNISHNGGFSTNHLLALIQAATEIIMPEEKKQP